MVQIHILTADTSIELMERANAVLAELQAQCGPSSPSPLSPPPRLHSAASPPRHDPFS
jgi:hypothetical protein